MRTARLLTVSQHALWPGGVPAWGVPARGVYLHSGGGTCLGVASQGVYLPRVYLPGGVPAQVLPPLWTDKHL